MNQRLTVYRRSRASRTRGPAGVGARGRARPVWSPPPGRPARPGRPLPASGCWLNACAPSTSTAMARTIVVRFRQDAPLEPDPLGRAREPQAGPAAGAARRPGVRLGRPEGGDEARGPGHWRSRPPTRAGPQRRLVVDCESEDGATTPEVFQGGHPPPGPGGPARGRRTV